MDVSLKDLKSAGVRKRSPGDGQNAGAPLSKRARAPRLDDDEDADLADLVADDDVESAEEEEEGSDENEDASYNGSDDDDNDDEGIAFNDLGKGESDEEEQENSDDVSILDLGKAKGAVPSKKASASSSSSAGQLLSQQGPHSIFSNVSSGASSSSTPASSSGANSLNTTRLQQGGLLARPPQRPRQGNELSDDDDEDEEGSQAEEVSDSELAREEAEADRLCKEEEEQLERAGLVDDLDEVSDQTDASECETLPDSDASDHGSDLEDFVVPEKKKKTSTSTGGKDAIAGGSAQAQSQRKNEDSKYDSDEEALYVPPKESDKESKAKEGEVADELEHPGNKNVVGEDAEGDSSEDGEEEEDEEEEPSLEGFEDSAAELEEEGDSEEEEGSEEEPEGLEALGGEEDSDKDENSDEDNDREPRSGRKDASAPEASKSKDKGSTNGDRGGNASEQAGDQGGECKDKLDDDLSDLDPVLLDDKTQLVDEKPRGVCYLPRLPPYMRPDKIRHLLDTAMGKAGAVARIFLRPEDEKAAKHRQKMYNANRKTKYLDGWVEFYDKKKAKKCADCLNATPVGGKKRHNYYRDDLWNIKYLHKFKWSEIKEEERYNRQVRKQRLEQENQRARRENEFLFEQVFREKVGKKIAEKRGKSGKGSSSHTGDASCVPLPGGEGARLARTAKETAALEKKPLSSKVLAGFL
ncbi:unnamed protein product [Amoebophrya sp. A25]|nr:unnamed protein product [Amoebophrya sp. A25]|eukprot:GSA25T00000805001.1